MGIRPVMNDARPAVQLAWPYQLVNSAPSLAMRSTFGVGCPRAAPPPVYAPKSFQPVSSVMSMTMFGFLPFAWVLARTGFGFGAARARSCPLLAPSVQHVPAAFLTGLLSWLAMGELGGSALAARNTLSLPEAAT